MILEPAPAKINLALHIRARRADGYHELETLFAFAEDGDLITLAEAEQDSFTITGPFADALKAGEGCHPTDNLVIRALHAFRTAFAVTAHHAITLTKNLPVASGIGGGSADAAATLRALATLHAVPAKDPKLVTIAERLGADVPACLLGETTLGTGIGTALTAIGGARGTPLLLVNPGVAVSTAAVFAGWHGEDLGPIPDGSLLDRARAARNDLEPPARAIAPVIGEVRALLDAAPGAVLSRMSGSGATCFALFDSIGARDAAGRTAAARGWWTLATALN
ncbi:4-(cytidine 5'-diphospho)-2-C-methyl-D-erythritol kinase [Sphingomonas sp. KR1UV-12]|uniref:4-diphosphocytidyl-2-C-methyl-D-erythritol kinase n=1 Tax=Sphingomonas aurea TaxID=3063994 RepID=A0ABT9EH86_9SPHN|nr:4-(cytidine 5'-diphospho)-2-C-methyl-D-erythritol kinase [Sphingomonas sp. KR1UV-12]MDP1026212.1 4-(cytidine 5'-diphospho)-2-C-methyl-D-erythritol kinase [Sphingomonas sp. KR1UV-12]